MWCLYRGQVPPPIWRVLTWNPVGTQTEQVVCTVHGAIQAFVTEKLCSVLDMPPWTIYRRKGLVNVYKPFARLFHLPKRELDVFEMWYRTVCRTGRCIYVPPL